MSGLTPCKEAITTVKDLQPQRQVLIGNEDLLDPSLQCAKGYLLPLLKEGRLHQEQQRILKIGIRIIYYSRC